MKKYNFPHILATIYFFSLFNISFLYFSRHEQRAYLIFMFTLCIFSVLIVALSIYSLDAHNSSLLCVIGCMNGTSILFMTLTLPLTWVEYYTKALTTSGADSLFIQSFIIFVLLFCLATLLVFNYFDQPLIRKKICYSYMSFTLIIFTVYLMVNHTLTHHNSVPYNYFIFCLVIILITSLLTIFASIHIANKKNLLKERINSFVLARLTLLSLTIILSYGLSYFIPRYPYMIILLTCVFLFFRIIMSDSILQHSQRLMKKLELHHDNTKLMNAYLTHMSHEQEVLTQQYHYINSLYSQMMFFYPNALFIIVNQNIYHVNENARTLLKYKDLDLIMDTCFMDYIAPDDRPIVEDIIHSLYRCIIEFETVDVHFITSTGELVDVELYLTLSHDDRVRAIIASAKDISDKKQRDQLQQAIELEKIKVEFFCTISHELKTPVNIIYSATQLQNNFINNHDYDKIPHYNTMIEQNCMRLLRLLNNFLDINRIESRYFNISPRTLNIVMLTENILDSIIPYTERKNITAIFDTYEEEVYCTVDPDLMERILLNLFSNAIKYGHEDGHIWVTVTLETSYVCIHIKDDGVGIPDESKELIFERFTRIENGLIRKAEGAGIGLSLVKSFVELNKGFIEVESKVNQGTEFIIKFPIETNPTLLHNLDYTYMTGSDKVDIEFSDLYMD